MRETRVHWANDEVSAGVVASYLRSEGYRARVVREDPSIFLWGRAAVGGFAVVVPEPLADEAMRALDHRPTGAERHERAMPPARRALLTGIAITLLLVAAALLGARGLR